MGIVTLFLGCTPSPEPAPAHVPTIAATPVPELVDADLDGFTSDVDCDDEDFMTYPGAPRRSFCQGSRDDNCDGLIDYQEDFDGDGYTECDEDCDDHDPSVSPGAADPEDGVDTNCDGTDGVGEAPVLLLEGYDNAFALGRTLKRADVDGDGCDDLVYTESGLTHGGLVDGYTVTNGWLHVQMGCRGGDEVRSYLTETVFAEGIGQQVVTTPGADGDLLVASSGFGTGAYGGVWVVDFSDPTPRLESVLEGGVEGFQVAEAAVLHRETTTMLVTDHVPLGTIGGFAYDFPLADVESATGYDSMWWGPDSVNQYGIDVLAIDRNGDGLEELAVSWIDSATLAGGFEIRTGPEASDVVETWEGDVQRGLFFASRMTAAPDLPTIGDRSLLAQTVPNLDLPGSLSAVHVIEDLGPGVHSINDVTLSFEAETQLDWFGSGTATGDVNGDGHVDVVIGAPFYLDGIDENLGPPGKVFVWLGPFTEGVLTREDARVFVGTQPHEGFGFSVETADLDDDGTDEIYVGAPMHTPEEFGVFFRNGALYRIDL